MLKLVSLKQTIITISLLFYVQAMSQSEINSIPGGPEFFSCGIYNVKGVVHKIVSSKIFIFELYPGTRRSFKLEVSGDIKQGFPKKYRVNEIIKDKFPLMIEVKVVRPGQGLDVKSKFVNFKKLIEKSRAFDNAVTQVKANPCS